MYCTHILGKWLYSQKDMHLRTLTTAGAGAAKGSVGTGNKMLPERASKIQLLIDQGKIIICVCYAIHISCIITLEILFVVCVVYIQLLCVSMLFILYRLSSLG